MQLVGKINKSHGVNGDLIIQHNINIPKDISKWDAFMIAIQPGSYIPFFIEEITPFSKTEMRCKLEEINSREEVNALLNKEVYASPNYHVTQNLTNFISLVDFEIYNNETRIGKIISLLTHGKIELFEVSYLEKIILIPAQRELILNIDEENNIIYMNLPDGLLDL